jgi:hypothetical protein
MATEHERLLVESYRGECFGEAFFSTLADRSTDDGQVEKLRALATIEARTAAVVHAHATEAGITGDPAKDDEARRHGVELGEQAAAGAWPDIVRGLHDALPGFLADFVRLRELAPDPHAPALETLVAHEQTINAFAELELAGHADLSLAVLRRYLERVA